MNANEFGSLNQASGLVKVWCWQRGACLKSYYILNTNTQNIYSYVIDPQNEMIIFMHCHHDSNIQRKPFMSTFDLKSGKLETQPKSREHKIKYGAQCLYVMFNLII